MYKKALLFIIVSFALFLRTYQLEQYPVSVSWDEAAIGYNAYSIIKTGADEYGVKYPILFKSFSDYKLPGYIYSVSISELFFGLSPFAVRLPSAIYGALTVIAVYLLVKELFHRENKNKEEKNLSFNYSANQLLNYLPFLASFLLAISPWHLQFSRGGFEANGQLFFLTLGFYFLIRFLRNPWSLVWSAFFLGISFYFYYTTRILTPLLGLIFAVLFWRRLLANKKQFIISVVIFILTISPLVPYLLRESSERVSQVSILNDRSINIAYSQAMARHPDSLIAKIIYNRRFAFLNTFLENYFRNNSLEFFFTGGDLYPRHDILGMGVLYLWEMPFFILGIYFLLRLQTKKKWFIISWWLIGGIPASLTTGAPHALRTLSTLPVYIIFTSLGIYFSFIFLKRRKELFAKIYLLFLPILIGYYFISYIFFYYDFTAPVYATDWGDGHKQLVEKVNSIQNNYDEVLVTGRFFKPYIYFLFYEKYDPALYQAEKGSDAGFSKYKFYPADWEKSGEALENMNFSNFNPVKKTLVVLPSDFAKKNLKTVAVIKGKFEEKVFVLQESLKKEAE